MCRGSHAFVVCTGTQGYSDQQLIAGRAIHASFTWLNRERDDVGKYRGKEIGEIVWYYDLVNSSNGFCTNGIKPEGTS